MRIVLRFGCDGASCDGTNGTCPTECVTDADCAVTHFCDMLATTPTCQPKGAPGDACARPGECGTTAPFCSPDGVCCMTDCLELCQACAAANKESGANSGECGNARTGTDPAGDCDPDTTNVCGQTGECAAGACQLASATTSCGPTICVDGTVTGQICDGSGNCQNDTNGTPCTPYVCSNNACTSPCADDADCVSTHYCLGGTCLTRQANGLGCAADNECASDFCRDGVCCDGACTGQCEACNQAGFEGECLPVTGEPVAPRQPCAGTPPCQGTCDGGDTTACTFPDTGTPCGEVSCDGNSALPAPTCDGVGVCASTTPENCGFFACDDASGGCLTACSTDGDCASGATCDAADSACVPVTGTCRDGVTLVEPGGAETSCAPYRCVAGSCQQQCTDDGDCAPGNRCESSSCLSDPNAGGGGAGGSADSATGPDGGIGVTEIDGGAGAPPSLASNDEGSCGCKAVGSRSEGVTAPSGSSGSSGSRLRRAVGGAGVPRTSRGGRAAARVRAPRLDASTGTIGVRAPRLDASAAAGSLVQPAPQLGLDQVLHPVR